MKTLLIYDTTGYIYLQMSGSYRVPVGMTFLEIEVPTDKVLKSINTNITPNIPIYEDIPKTELELAKERIESLENYVLTKENPTI